MNTTDPSLDVAAIRARARNHIEDGAVIEHYGADRQAVVAMPNSALATGIVCQLCYQRHHFTAQSLASEAVAKEFQAHAQEERRSGTPTGSPRASSRSAANPPARPRGWPSESTPNT